jgi:Hypothetical protein (DUF2513)
MKRDMDLLRALLLKIEEMPYSGGHLMGSIQIPGHTDEEVCYHAQLAQDEGFIIAKFLKPTTYFAVERLTAEGHTFLDLARDDTRWGRAKEKVEGATGTLTIEALKMALNALVQAAVKAALP